MSSTDGPSTDEPSTDELVVLLDDAGRPNGTADKRAVHGAHTPYHLAFSCYAFDPDDRLLVTRRAWTKQTFPGLWTNSCCGHPAPDEATDEAVRRRLRHELGLAARALRMALPEFSYRASLHGVEEHELCPVFVARVDAEPRPHPDEVAEVTWCTWPEFIDRAAASDSDLSPWARLQAAQLDPQVPRYLAETAR